MNDMTERSEDQVAWDAVADFWQERMGEGNDFVEVLIWPAVRSMLPDLSGASVLDVGCGNGLYSRKMAAAGAVVTAIDYSEGMIRCARRESLGSGIEYSEMDAREPETFRAIPSGAFDAVLSTMVLMDMSDLSALFGALPRVLKPGAPFVFATSHPSFNSAHAQLDAGGDGTSSIRVDAYMTSGESQGDAIPGQPTETWVYHRSLTELLKPAFAAGLILDALEERAFPADHPQGMRANSWGGRFHEFPAVLVGRMRALGVG